MFTEKELEAYKAKDNTQKAERERVKKEMVVKVIEANNKLHSIVKSFQQYVEENHAQLIGKKLFLVDGGCSKVMNTFFEAWKTTIELTNWDWCYFSMGSGNSTKLNIRLTVFGGSSRTNNPLEIDTTYNKKIENTIWNIIKIDKTGVYVDYDMSKRFLIKFDYDTYEMSFEDNKMLRVEIKALEAKISENNKFIPQQLIEN